MCGNTYTDTAVHGCYGNFIFDYQEYHVHMTNFIWLQSWVLYLNRHHKCMECILFQNSLHCRTLNTTGFLPRTAHERTSIAWGYQTTAVDVRIRKVSMMHAWRPCSPTQGDKQPEEHYWWSSRTYQPIKDHIETPLNPSHFQQTEGSHPRPTNS